MPRRLKEVLMLGIFIAVVVGVAAGMIFKDKILAGLAALLGKIGLGRS
jgi:hypothetical protein